MAAQRVFSLIVPVYNTPEGYLRECLDSLMAQTYPHWQAVLVDDGSQPDTAALCDRLCAADSRLQVIHQPNGGVSAARNRGIDAATGDYLLFIDPDDWVDASMLETLNARLDEHPLDVLWYGLLVHWSDHTESKPMTHQPIVLMDDAMALDAKVGVLDELKRRFPACSGSACVLAIRRECLKSAGLRFPLGVRMGEDKLFVLELLSQGLRMGMVGDCFYHYRCHQSSAMRAYREDGLSDYHKTCKLVADYAARQPEPEARKAAVYSVVSLCYVGAQSTLWHPDCKLSLRQRCLRWRAFADDVCRDCAAILGSQAEQALSHSTIIRLVLTQGLQKRSYLRLTLARKAVRLKRRIMG